MAQERKRVVPVPVPLYDDEPSSGSDTEVLSDSEGDYEEPLPLESSDSLPTGLCSPNDSKSRCDITCKPLTLLAPEAAISGTSLAIPSGIHIKAWVGGQCHSSQFTPSVIKVTGSDGHVYSVKSLPSTAAVLRTAERP